MVKRENQKLKAMYIAKYLLENTDENHAYAYFDVNSPPNMFF